jgi:hypothetical protein
MRYFGILMVILYKFLIINGICCKLVAFSTIFLCISLIQIYFDLFLKKIYIKFVKHHKLF